MESVIGVVGLGIMGGAMAEALLAAGHRVVGYDPLPAARHRLRRAGGRPLASSAAVAERAAVVITSLATAAALDDAAGRIAAAKRPQCRIVIETSTLALADKDRAAIALGRRGITTLDCPVSGTAVRLKEGAWTIFASGSRSAFRRVEPILNVFTGKVPYVGKFGNGTKMKYAANHLVAILNVATAESITLGRKMGLDPRQLLELFGPSPIVGTGVYRLRGAMMAAREYVPPTMKVEVWQKDMQVIGDMAKSLDCPTPLFTACAPIYSAAMAQGLAQSDTASVCEVLGLMAGLGRSRGPARVRGASIPPTRTRRGP
ncbi:MAG: NAD(P)-dependent oxidoreductase [Betaproteobacteria bacterium]|nr:NAD(P)-dependent oxidoreductase [Betaproteobacteria bacterium]